MMLTSPLAVMELIGIAKPLAAASDTETNVELPAEMVSDEVTSTPVET